MPADQDIDPALGFGLAEEIYDTLVELRDQYDSMVSQAAGLEGGYAELAAGISQPVEEDEWKVLDAACEAQKQTGLPLYIHPYFGARSRVAPEVAKYALRKGVDPQKINMCHMDENMTLDYQRRVADLEVFISFDNFGLEIYYDSLEFNYNSHDSQRHDHLLKLLDLGYGDQILVSQDVCYKAQLTLYGGLGYAHILRNIVPALRYAGVDDDTLDLILVRNPFRLLSY